jgi:hypothetical protein
LLWIDAVADHLNDVDYGQLLFNNQPDYIVFEANMAVYERYCEIIEGIKTVLPNIKVIFCGQCLEVLSAEEKGKCKADFFCAGKDWHFEVFKLITGQDWPKDRLLPHINRMITRWWLYAYKNNNLKFIPATYICAEGRPVEDVLQEVEELIVAGFKEIVDESAVFPHGVWLKTFCQEMIDRGYNRFISFNCRVNTGLLQVQDFELMAKAGFRILFWDFSTADTLKKDLVLARTFRLENNLSVKFGYPQEIYEQALNIYRTIKWLVLNNWVFSVQAEMLPLNKDAEIIKLVKSINNLIYHPYFIWNRIKAIRSFNDLRYYFNIGKKIFDRFGNFYQIGKASLDY